MGRGRKGGGRGNLRRTEHSIIVVKSFIVLYCFSPAILEGKGDWSKLLLCCSGSPQVSFFGFKFGKITLGWTTPKFPAGEVKVPPMFLQRSIREIVRRLLEHNSVG